MTKPLGTVADAIKLIISPSACSLVTTIYLKVERRKRARAIRLM